ncbi:MAG: MFS transporter [bacterium]
MNIKKTTEIFSWSMYDFANTIFSMNILSLYFALWVTVDMGGKDIYYSAALAVSTILMIFCMPLLGIISDEYNQRMPFLIACTLLSVFCTALIGFAGSIFVGLICFVPAYFGYQVSLVFYDALLPQIAGSSSRIGRVSGYGVALGYVGAIAGLKMVEPFVKQPGTDIVIRSNAFIPTAVFFLLFALPCFLVIKDIDKKKISGNILKRFPAAFKKLINTFKNVRQYPDMFMFLLANLAYCDAINTIFTFMGIYAVKVVNFNNAQIIKFLMISTTSAAAGSFMWGYITDWWGNKKTMILILAGWVAALTIAMISQSQEVFWLVGPIAGVSLGGTWVTGRSIVVKLAPEGMLGEFFGLYGFTEKFTAIVGPMMWGVTVYIFNRIGCEVLGYRIAVATLLAAIILGFILFLFVEIPETKKESI